MKRHLKRLWISVSGGRAVPPPWQNTREFRSTHRRQAGLLQPT
jgi:hypothetical protein